MHYIISAAMRILLATLMFLGTCLLVFLGLLSLIRELFADQLIHAPALTDEGSRRRDSLAPQVATVNLNRALRPPS